MWAVSSEKVVYEWASSKLWLLLSAMWDVSNKTAHNTNNWLYLSVNKINPLSRTCTSTPDVCYSMFCSVIACMCDIQMLRCWLQWSVKQKYYHIFQTIRCIKILDGKFREKCYPPLDHKQQGNVIQYFPGKKCALWSAKYGTWQVFMSTQYLFKNNKVRETLQYNLEKESLQNWSKYNIFISLI